LNAGHRRASNQHPPTLAESIAQHYAPLTDKLDRTPWSHLNSDTIIPASQVAIPARVVKRIPARERKQPRDRDEDDFRHRIDPEIVRLYELAHLDRDREVVPWTQERRSLKRAVLTGAPGGGKTFLSQTMVLDLARERQQQLQARGADLDQLPLPIMVELKKLAEVNHPGDFGAALIHVLAEQYHYPVRGCLEKWFLKRLPTRSCWIILDGLDELDEARRPGVHTHLGRIEASGSAGCW
jgi:hypothetical protein